MVKSHLPATVVVLLSLVLAVVMTLDGGVASLVNVLVTGGMWALLAAGLALVFGVMNIPTFAHGESFMVGAYVGYFVFIPLQEHLADHPNPLLSLSAPIIGILGATLAGIILGAVTERMVLAPLRKRTKEGWIMNTFLLTAGLSFILINGATILLGSNFMGIPRYYDVSPVSILGLRISVDRLMAFLIAVVIIVALTWFMKWTRTGRAIRAVSQDETGAQLVGINMGFIHTLTYSLSTAMAAAAGAALLFMFQAYPTVGHDPNYYAWYVVMLVGFGNIYGAVVGGFIVALLQAATQQYIGIAWSDVVPTVVMIVILIVVPSGIFGSVVKGIHEQS
ncbi:MAG: branched-chain amino acid ABC transporter permease [Holophaga sp.]|nr:branched-chain amino acid ABC transporter permease [Holophaga sp.]